MGLIYEILDEKRAGECEESVSRLVHNNLQRQLRPDSRPTHYFYLTEMVNPIQAYWSRKRPDVERPAELAQRLALGQRLQRMATGWFRMLPHFVIDETKVDTEWIGFRGVVGKIDYRVGDSIIELKTKPGMVEDPNTIIQRYPQDLEQLCFYAAMLPDNVREHYLVFMKAQEPYEMSAFKIELGNIGNIRHLLQRRHDELKRALEEDDPARLGKCRYFDGGCEFGHANVCNCNEQADLRTNVLEREVEIQRDDDMEARLETAREEASERYSDSYWTWDLILPRKWFFSNVLQLQENGEQDIEKYAKIARLTRAIYATSEIRPTRAEMQNERIDLEMPIGVPRRFVKLRSSRTTEPLIVPFTTKAPPNMTPQQANNLPEIYLAELGVHCGVLGKTSGVIFVMYSRPEPKVLAYVIKFRGADALRNIVNNAIEGLDSARESQDFNGLDNCPDFWCRDCGFDDCDRG